ncbi:YHYH protein [Jiulongibacter sediminis]|uniref:YHYH protein n=1 Tax=Jiulongibacter sediminis TaxID=1605367 RepID=UPI0026ECEADB|nr:YHYH protein [Jiulongibacter sediminis]
MKILSIILSLGILCSCDIQEAASPSLPTGNPPQGPPPMGMQNGGQNTNAGTNSGTAGEQSFDNNNTDLASGYKYFESNVEVYQEGDYMVINTTGIPNHGSPYFNSSDSRYEAYNGSNSQFFTAPNSISNSPVTYRIPLSPTKASSAEATPLGPIGVALNGIPFYNQYAAGRSPLTNEINTFDQYNGHPQQQGQYHYHVEPLYLTLNKGKDALLGYLLDGFPVYGPEENGNTVSNNELDAYHGHAHATADYPNGIYHYHITDADPYINGSGFYGNPGTISR